MNFPVRVFATPEEREDWVREMMMRDKCATGRRLPRTMGSEDDCIIAGAEKLKAAARAKRDEMAGDVRSMWDAGMKICDIALKMGISSTTVSRIIAENAMPLRERDDSRIRRKIESRYLEIYSRFDGRNFSDLASRFGVSEMTIRRAVDWAKSHEAAQ